jgi:hypothetical protein
VASILALVRLGQARPLWPPLTRAPWVIHMVSVSVQSPASAADHAGPSVALEADFDTRWAAWVTRGRIHEQRVRRRSAMWAGVLAVGGAIVYAFLRS